MLKSVCPPRQCDPWRRTLPSAAASLARVYLRCLKPCEPSGPRGCLITLLGCLVSSGWEILGGLQGEREIRGGGDTAAGTRDASDKDSPAPAAATGQSSRVAPRDGERHRNRTFFPKVRGVLFSNSQDPRCNCRGSTVPSNNPRSFSSSTLPSARGGSPEVKNLSEDEDTLCQDNSGCPHSFLHPQHTLPRV